MAEIGRAQDSLGYEIDNSVFLAVQIKDEVGGALSRDMINADDVARWLRWGVKITQTLPTLSAGAIEATRKQYRLGSDQAVTDAAAAIVTAWAAVQTWMFANYPRSPNGYLEGYRWSAADAEPEPRVVTPIPAPLVTRLEAFRDAFTTA